MKIRPALAFVVLVLVATLALFLWKIGGPARADAEPATPATTPAVAAPGTDLATAPATTESPTGAATDRAPARDAPPPAARVDEGPRVVVGRVVDARHAPIGDARLVEVSHPDVIVRTDENGRFEWRSELGAGAKVVVRAGPWHARAVLPLLDLAASASASPARDAARTSAPPGGDANPRIVDVGDVVLADRGAARGRVVDEANRPVARARIEIVDAPDGASASTTTDDDGQYAFESLVEGRHALKLVAERHLAVLKITFAVELRRTTEIETIVLQRSPTISGVVVDDTGAPAADVDLQAYPTEGFYPGVNARSGSDGSFRFHLSGVSPHVVTVRASERFEAYGVPRRSDAPTYAPGARDVRIALERARLVTFRVLAAETRAPIEEFGFRVDRDTLAGQRFEPEGPIESHPGGEVRRAVTKDLSRAVAWAPGRAPVDVLVRPDPGTVDHMTLVLARGASLAGRVVASNEPVPGATVTVFDEIYDADLRPVPEPVPGQSGKRANDALPRPLVRTVLTDAAGRFLVSELPAGRYAVRVALKPKATNRARTLLREVAVGAGASVDVGDVVLARGVLVRGRLVAPVGESPRRFFVAARPATDPDGSARASGATTQIEGEDGTFEFAGLAPGDWTFAWARPDAPPKALAPHLRGATTRPGLVEGETIVVVLDASDSRPCALDVRVTRNGRGLGQTLVHAEIADEAGTWSTSPRFLGRADENGRLSATIEGGLRFRLVASLDKSTPLAWSEPLDSTPDGRLAVELQANVGRLVLVVPPSHAPPTQGVLSVRLRLGERALPTRTLPAETSRFHRPGEPAWTVGSLDLGEFAAGDYQAEIEFTEWNLDATPPEEKPSVHRSAYPTVRSSVTVRAGANATLTWP